MAAERATKIRYLLAFWLFVISSIGFLDRTNVAIAGPELLKFFGLGNERLGLLSTVFLIGYAGFQLPAGILAAKFGPRRVLTAGIIWWACCSGITALLPQGMASAVAVLIGIRFALGLGESVMFPSANQFVSRWIPQRERGFVNGLIFAGVGAGSGLTPPLLRWIIGTYGWRSAFLFSCSLGLTAGIVWFVMARDTPQEQKSVSAEELAEIEAGLRKTAPDEAQTIPPEVVEEKISLGRMFQRIDLPALMLSYFGYGYIAYVFFSWFFLYMAQERGVNLKTSAFYSMLPFLSMTVGCLVGGALSDRLSRSHGLRVGRCYLATVAMVLTAGFLLVGSQVHSAGLAAVILAGGAGTLYLSQSTFWSASIELAGRSSGVFSSVVNMANQIGGAITASLTPWIAHKYGWTTAFAVASALAVIGGFAWLVVHPERPLEA